MTKLKLMAVALAFVSVASAEANNTNCIVNGNMAHCNTIGQGGMTSTDCMMIGNQVSCNSIGGQSTTYDDSGASAGQGIADLTGAINEKNFRKKVGSFLAAGDCHGATQFALKKGRLEIADYLARSCAGRFQSPSVAMGAPSQIETEARKLFAAGDCQGAAKLAYRNGKISLGDQLLAQCPKE